MSRCRILHITANDADHRLIAELLSGDGDFSFDHARSSDAALADLRAVPAHQRSNLILMPWLGTVPLSGAELLRELKNDDALRSIPVVVLTTGVSPEQDHIWFLGAAAVVQLPSDADGLTATFDALRRFWTEVARLPYCEAG